MTTATLIVSPVAEALTKLPDASVHTCVTSPPYWGLRDYGVEGQIGLEQTPDEYVARIVEVFRAVRRVLRDDGTLWLNLGDSYNNAGSSRNGEGLDGSRRGGATGAEGACGYKKRDTRRTLLESGIKHKDLVGIPWRVAFALQADGWYLRQDIIWHKPNPMPSSVTDRCVTAHEHLFLLSKSERYHFDTIKEPAACAGQNRGGSTKRYEQNTAGMDRKIYNTRTKRSVWSVQPDKFKGAHFATFPPDLIEPCILAGAPVGGTVLDPFAGTGTTGAVAAKHRRNSVLVDADPRLAEWFAERKQKVCPTTKLDIVVQGPTVCVETLHA